jgi:hypothetical protein
MKILFCDIDGVLNSEAFFAEKTQNGTIYVSDNFPYSEICPNAVANLNHICAETGAFVVVSSTWRHGRTVGQLKDLFNGFGFTGKIKDKTPDLSGKVRGYEIQEWLDLHSERWTEYAIVDDDGDMLDCQKNNFVQTSFKTGLDRECADRLIAILNSGEVETVADCIAANLGSNGSSRPPES